MFIPGELFAPPNPLGRYCLTCKILEYIINRKASALRFFYVLDPPRQAQAPPGGSHALGCSRALGCSHTRGQSARETHAPGHITLWLPRPLAPLGLHRRWSLANYFQNAELTTSTPPPHLQLFGNQGVGKWPVEVGEKFFRYFHTLFFPPLQHADN